METQNGYAWTANIDTSREYGGNYVCIVEHEGRRQESPPVYLSKCSFTLTKMIKKRKKPHK